MKKVEFKLGRASLMGMRWYRIVRGIMTRD